MRVAIVCLLGMVAACTEVRPVDSSGAAAVAPSTAPAAAATNRPAPGGNFFVINQPIAEVHTLLRGEFSELGLVVSSERVTGVDGRFNVSSANAAVNIITTALSPSATRVNIYSSEYVWDGRNSRAGDARFRFDLQAILLARLADLFREAPAAIPDKV